MDDQGIQASHGGKDYKPWSYCCKYKIPIVWFNNCTNLHNICVCWRSEMLISA